MKGAGTGARTLRRMPAAALDENAGCPDWGCPGIGPLLWGVKELWDDAGTVSNQAMPALKAGVPPRLVEYSLALGPVPAPVGFVQKT